jgi:hypothetical protein
MTDAELQAIRERYEYAKGINIYGAGGQGKAHVAWYASAQDVPRLVEEVAELREALTNTEAKLFAAVDAADKLGDSLRADNKQLRGMVAEWQDIANKAGGSVMAEAAENKRLREALERVMHAQGLADAVVIADYALAGKDDRDDIELSAAPSAVSADSKPADARNAGGGAATKPEETTDGS